jgi:chemotaxis protein histidine kinase CheA
MSRRRSKTSATGGNLDSMLDTLTNVVGILVIVLVAVQLSSQEAASRIAEQLEKIDPQEVARLEQAAADAKEQAEEAAEALREQRQAVTDPRAELSRLEATLQIEQDLARQAAARAAELEKQRTAQLEAAAAAAKQAAAATAKQEAAREAAEQRLAEMRRELENLPLLTAPPAKEVRLPDPRPAPQGVKELRVLCRERRVWLVDSEALQAKAQKRADYVVRSKKLDPDNVRWILDGQTFVEEFNKAPVRDGGFTMSLKVVNNRWPQLVLERGSGEQADDAIKGTGDLARALRRFKPDTHIVRFFVWPDTFEEYLKVREFTNQRGFAAGWEPATSPEEHAISLGKYAIGVKPPPAPPPPAGTKPPPRPNVVD